MPPYHSVNPSVRQTTASQKGGCLSGFLVPPLAVIAIGALLAFFLLGAGPSTPAKAAPVQTTPPASAVENSVATTLAPQTAGSELSPIFRPEVLYWSNQIKKWAAEAGLDPNLVATVMQIESCGYVNALSSAGAIGLFQVMPYHFASGDSPYNPDTNALRGLAYLKRSLDAANGNARLALAGYNGGIGVIGQPEYSWAAQTQNYAYSGSSLYNEATQGSAAATNLHEKMNASTGGAICRQAASMEGLNP